MTETRPRQRKGNQGSGNRRQPRNNLNAASNQAQQVSTNNSAEKDSFDAGILTNTQEDNADICWICAEPVKYYSVSECNHRTCHVCALRLRALYKKLDCTFCKVCPILLIINIDIHTTNTDQRNHNPRSFLRNLLTPHFCPLRPTLFRTRIQNCRYSLRPRK
jgi:hypothetical protein